MMVSRIKASFFQLCIEYGIAIQMLTKWFQIRIAGFFLYQQNLVSEGHVTFWGCPH